MTLLDPRMRELWVDWEVIGREAIAHLRGASARYPDVERVKEVLDELRELSPEFRQWWAEHDVATPRAPRKRFAHPTHGELAFFNEAMELIGEGLLFMVYVPADDRTREACVELATPHAPRQTTAVRRPAFELRVLLKAAENGGAAVIRTSDTVTEMLGYIDAPWAVDANGERLPTSYRIEEDELIGRRSPFGQGTPVPQRRPSVPYDRRHGGLTHHTNPPWTSSSDSNK